MHLRESEYNGEVKNDTEVCFLLTMKHNNINWRKFYFEIELEWYSAVLRCTCTFARTLKISVLCDTISTRESCVLDEMVSAVVNTSPLSVFPAFTLETVLEKYSLWTSHLGSSQHQ